MRYFRLKKNLLNIEAGEVFKEEEIQHNMLYIHSHIIRDKMVYYNEEIDSDWWEEIEEDEYDDSKRLEKIPVHASAETTGKNISTKNFLCMHEKTNPAECKRCNPNSTKNIAQECYNQCLAVECGEGECGRAIAEKFPSVSRVESKDVCDSQKKESETEEIDIEK